MDGQPEIDRHIADTAKAYDSLPYVSNAIFRSHPARLGAVARLYGLDPVPLARARVLELGCAAGGNLIPLAARYPEARFVGIDLGQRMIADGQARIAALGLGNIDLRFESITDFGEDDGPFDYIICHGVYSWVPAEVSDTILAICGRQLSDQGVAYVSYNVLPGWRLLQPIRDAMRVLPDAIGEVPRAQQGRGLINFLAKAAPEQGIWGDLLRRVPGIIGHDDAYLFHEFMEPVNEPRMFFDFVNAANSRGLAYLGESELALMYPQAHGHELAAHVESVSDDIVQQQQTLDLLTGTSFRTSLLVKDALTDRIDRSGAGARLGSLFLTKSPIYDYERVSEAQAKMVPNRGAEHTITDPMALALYDRLFTPVPTALSLQAWVEGLDLDAKAFSGMMANLIAQGIVVLLSEPLSAAGVSERPLADTLVRTDAAHGRDDTASLMHGPVGLTDDFRFILPLLDGEHTHAQLADAVAAGATQGAIGLERDDGSTATPLEFVAATLKAMARLGLLAA